MNSTITIRPEAVTLSNQAVYNELSVIRNWLAVGIVLIALSSVSVMLAGIVVLMLILIVVPLKTKSLAILMTGLLIAMINPSIVHDNIAAAFTRNTLYILAFFVSIMIGIRSTAIRNTPTLLLILSCMSSFIICIVTNASTDSIIRLAMFFACTFCVMQFIFISNAKDRHYARLMFAGLFTAVILASIATIPFGYGYEINGRDYQGALLHPQTFGIFLGTYAIILTPLLRNKYFAAFPLIILAFALQYLSWARTALWSTSLSFLYIFADKIMPRSGFLNKASVSAPIITLFSCIVASIGLGSLGQLGNSLSASSTFEGLNEARGFLMDRSFTNFLEHPMLGIGFATPSSQSFSQLYARQFGSDLTQEKGNLYIAILEENGIIGGSIWFLFFYSVFSVCSRHGVYARSALLYFSLVNMAEACGLSSGGIGLMLWLLLAVMRDDCKNMKGTV